MDALERKISETLLAEERALLDQFPEEGPVAQALGLFHGKSGWVAGVAVALSLGVIIIGIYAIVQILAVDDPVSAVRWGVVLVLAFVAQMMIKQWSWLRMESERLSREIKRLELLVAMRR